MMNLTKHLTKLSHGAEAVLYRKEEKEEVLVIKQRVPKSYRLPQLDESLRKFRTRREAKILRKLHEVGFPAPRLREFSDTSMSVTMDFLPGEKLREVLRREEDYCNLAREIGRKVGKMHAWHIMHGDLTTSNMILHETTNEIMLIDFGLASFSEKVEDKAVDLFLLERALESAHYQFYPHIFEEVLDGYKEAYTDAAIVLERLQKVKRRGRNKNK